MFICSCVCGPAGQCLAWLCWARSVPVVSWQVTGWFRMASLTHLVVSRPPAGVDGGLGHVSLIQRASLSRPHPGEAGFQGWGEQKLQGFMRPRLGAGTPSLPPHSLGQSKSQGQAKLKWRGNGPRVLMEGTADYGSHFYSPPHSPSSLGVHCQSSQHTARYLIPYTLLRQQPSTVLKHEPSGQHAWMQMLAPRLLDA